MTPSSLSVRHLSSETAERRFARAGPMVRIRFPPAESQTKLRPRALSRLRREEQYRDRCASCRLAVPQRGRTLTQQLPAARPSASPRAPSGAPELQVVLVVGVEQTVLVPGDVRQRAVATVQLEFDRPQALGEAGCILGLVEHPALGQHQNYLLFVVVSAGEKIPQ